MKTLLHNVLIQIFVLLVILLSIEIYLNIVDPDKYILSSYNEIFCGNNKRSVILGASHATHGINPRYISIDNFYNFALDGASPSFTLKWYKYIFSKHYESPKTVVYEVDWFMFSSNWLFRQLEGDSLYLPNNIIIELFAQKDMDRFSLAKNRIRVLQGGDLYKKIFYPFKEVDYSTSYNGFIATNYSNNLDLKRPRLKYDSSQLNDFISLIQLIKKNKSQLIFVQAPEYIPGRESKDILNQNKLLEDIANTYQIPFLNYNGDRVSELNYNKNLYADWGHLNKEGSTQFSRLLDKDLKTLCEY